MSDAVLLEIVKTTGIILSAVLSLIAVIWTAKGNKETKENNKEIKESRQEQKEMNIKVDGRLSQLLESEGRRRELEGHQAGVAEQKKETKIEATAPIKLEIPELKVTMVPPAIPPPEK